jgi:hypothetical protein
MKTETSGLLETPAQHAHKRSLRRRQTLVFAGTIMLLGSTMIAGSFLVGSTLFRSTSNKFADSLKDTSQAGAPAITTAKNIRWHRCEEDETMFCTVFT